jgi:hypothetical protein
MVQRTYSYHAFRLCLEKVVTVMVVISTKSQENITT